MRSFFRIATDCPPAGSDYRTQRDFRGDPPPGATGEALWAWDAYSAFDSPEGARKTAHRFLRLGRHIVRYDVPEDAGIEWRKTFGPGHYSLKGDQNILHGFLADACLDV